MHIFGSNFDINASLLMFGCGCRSSNPGVRVARATRAACVHNLLSGHTTAHGHLILPAALTHIAARLINNLAKAKSFLHPLPS